MIDLLGLLTFEDPREVASFLFKSMGLTTMGYWLIWGFCNLCVYWKAFVTDTEFNRTSFWIYSTLFDASDDHYSENSEGVWILFYITGMIWTILLPPLVFTLLYFWEASCILALFVGLSFLMRGSVRFNKKLNKHMKDKEAHKGGEE